MRIGDVLAIQWDQVDIAEREIHLEPGTTKNDEARTLPLHGELLEVIQIQRDIHDRKHPACQRVFSHGGKPIRNLFKAWRTACVKVDLGRIVCAACSGEIGESGECARCSGRTAKYVGLIPHDLRRTGVRNLIRAGVPRSVAMKISLHKAKSVFERYNITSQEDLREVARSLTRYLETKHSQSTTKVTVAQASSENQTAISLLN